MIDIHFYMAVSKLKSKIMRNKEKFSKNELLEFLESYRRKEPVIYNIETTNACNMRCEMCPRTTMMTRSIETLPLHLFYEIVDQIKPFSKKEWAEWVNFVEAYYEIPRDSMSENHFFLYVIPKVIVMHGYGDPLLDRNMPERIRFLTEKKIPSYFSCNPANINLEKTVEMFENGLDYVKFSIESVDDLRHKEVRGQASNFSDSYEKIMHLLDIKNEKKYKTTIVITMINLNKSWQQEEFQRLKEAFDQKDVYIYLKSQDQQWYSDNNQETRSIHWIEFCQFPWSSMTIKSNGEAAQCVEDFNNEIILGDCRKESLSDIWNGKKYVRFRQDHLNLTPGIKCTEQCDMKLIGNFV